MHAASHCAMRGFFIEYLSAFPLTVLCSLVHSVDSMLTYHKPSLPCHDPSSLMHNCGMLAREARGEMGVHTADSPPGQQEEGASHVRRDVYNISARAGGHG